MSSQNTLKSLPTTPAKSGPMVEGASRLPTDTKSPSRIGLWVLGLGFGGFLLWAGLAPLDEGVPAPALVALDTKQKAVQHLTGGIVKQVFVKEGQWVKEGDPLVTLDDASMRANYESIRQRYLTLRAMEARLMAEQAGQATMTLHPDLKAAASDPYIHQIIDNQVQLLQSRRMSLQADQAAMQQSIQGQEASITGATGVLDARKSQLSYVKEELDGMRDLVKEGYAPRAKQLDLERMSADTLGSMADLQGNILRSRSAIAELRQRSIQRNQDYRKEVDGQLADIRREVQADADKFKAVSNDLDRTVIRSPAEGQVVGLIIQSVGAVVAPGQKLMDIVPKNEELVLEAHISPHFIDKVHRGESVDVRFSAFSHTPQLVVEGKIESISADLLPTPPNVAPYFLARIVVTPEGMKKLGKHRMQAGMQSEVVIKTGERSMLTYLLNPLLKRMAASMKEE